MSPEPTQKGAGWIGLSIFIWAAFAPDWLMAVMGKICAVHCLLYVAYREWLKSMKWASGEPLFGPAVRTGFPIRERPPGGASTNQ